MTPDKPKHKPSKKRTLEEVLKSLQDLIRNDFVGPLSTASAPEQEVAISAAPAGATEKPDTFNAALEELDELITHEIIEPVERARRAPPPDMLIDDSTDADAFIERIEENTDDNFEHEPDVVERASDEKIYEEIRIEPPVGEETPVESTENRVSPPDPGAQDTFPFAEPIDIAAVETITVEEFNEPQSLSPAPAHDVKDTDHFSLENFPQSPPRIPANSPMVARLSSDANVQTPLTQDNDSYTDMGTPHRGVASDPAIERSDAHDAFEATPAEDDIPVLNEVADAALALGTAPLPGADQARDIAIRAIAKLNIERRKAGEPELDIKAIERLQRILSDVLSRHQNARKSNSNNH